MPDRLLDEPSRERLEQIASAGGPKGMPPLIDRAVEADDVWMGEISSLREQPLANVYAALYSSLSMTAHASVSAVGRFVVGGPPQLLVGYAQPLGDRSGPYDIAASLTAVVLVIASKRLGWPPHDEVYAAAMGQPAIGSVDFQRAMHGPHESATSRRSPEAE